MPVTVPGTVKTSGPMAVYVQKYTPALKEAAPPPHGPAGVASVVAVGSPTRHMETAARTRPIRRSSMNNEPPLIVWVRQAPDPSGAPTGRIIEGAVQPGDARERCPISAGARRDLRQGAANGAPGYC